MSIKNIIAIDGPAASGKGTLARKVAAALNFAHMDTGLLYRAVAYAVINQGLTPIEAARSLAGAGTFTFDKEALRSDEIGEAASKGAAIPEVRAALFDLQRSFALTPPAPFKGAVLDGRDIGTVIAPDAPVKIYVTAATEIRAARRLKELQSLGQNDTYDTVLRDMQGRDERDAARKEGPMKPADDAVILDTSALGPEEALNKALEIIREKCGDLF